MSSPLTSKSHKTRISWKRRWSSFAVISSLVLSPGAAMAESTFTNQAALRYVNPANGNISNTASNPLDSSSTGLVDPLGQILGCNGNLLPDYSGFSVSMYEPDATGLELGNLLPLPQTELPDTPNNGIPGGKAPNIQNSNPFFLTNTDQGRYNFLFDPAANLQSSINAGLQQTSVGAQYIIVVNPPATSNLPERRIKLQVISNIGVLRYTATALDGQPIAVTGGTQISQTIIEVNDAETSSLNLFSLALGMVMCESEQIQVTKTADRAAAQPGDTILYRLNIKNLADVALNDVFADDTLPAGFQFIPEATYAQLNGQTVPVQTQVNGSNITFVIGTSLPVNESVDIIYAVRLSPDALRGDGRNSVTAGATRTDNGFTTRDGPSVHQVVVDPGILSDCGTLIGRVFVDKNFDGEQQAGEAGVPNAVVFLEDGNRIIADADGLFSVDCMLPGHHTGVLDATSLPGYALAPNLYFRERNSQSRLVHLAPGGMVRMNFGVTPSFQEEAQ